ncbi:S-type anion channel SLAH2-like isoform X2 [Vigna unguiculata]|uniref:S-type anion channel SLAH2-like isoform X2 n=1 Tax=Vigna unguiculata TaxID=3917 RepID=UPI001016E039|nr:S-type anion channel SLAH2-like isoform X2 [Vigna unguiculata]
MENNVYRETEGHGFPKVPSLVPHISNVKKSSSFKESEKKVAGGQGDEQEHSVSINMPLNCEDVQLHGTARVSETDLSGNGAPIFSSESTTTYSKPPLPSQSMPNGSVQPEEASSVNFTNHESLKSLNDNGTNFCKTWYSKLEAKLSILRGRVHSQSVEEDNSLSNTKKPLPVDFLFVKASEDPQIQTPKCPEEMVHPQDKQWPFLLRFPISSFGICLGVSSQAILWKALATSPSTEFLHITPKINFVLWLISVAVVATIFAIYLFKIILYFEAVRREFHHAVRVNFFFAPWISLLFLALGVPSSFAKELHHAVWYILMIPLFFLMLKIYGQWMFGGKRMLSKVANPTNMLAIVGNFVGALLGASMGLREGPIFFFTIGLTHYMVIFVTLAQMLPTNKTLIRDLHPVFFLLVAPPSVAALALAKIQGSFHLESRIFYFTSMFLYLTLAVRVNLFRGLKFSISWWAYTFPVTAAAIATINYTNQVTNVVTQALSVMLSLISTFIVTTVFVSTIVHAFVLRDLFPNDLAIATSERKRKTHKKRFPLGLGSHGHAKKTESYLKFVNSDKNDLV